MDGAPSPHKSFYFDYGKHGALRKGDWKIVREKPNQPWQLFHLTEDLAESRNLADTHPERVQKLAKERARWQASF